MALLLGAAPTCSVEALNVPVASRVIAFVQPPYVGTVLAAIVFEPGSAASEAEADAIEQEIIAGDIGRNALHVRRVPSSALAGLNGVKIAFVTSGIRGQQELAEVASRYSVLTITSDLACVRASYCVLGVSNTSRAQIVVNRAAAHACRIRFGTAFLMLVKEI